MARTFQTDITLSAKLAATFKSVTGSAGNQLQRLAEQAKKLDAANKGLGGFSALGRELQSAKEKLNAAQFAEKQLATAMLGATKPTKAETDALKAAKKETAAAEKAFNRTTKAAEKQAAALRAAGVDTTRLTTEQARLRASLAGTERQMEALTRAADARKRVFGDKGIGERLFGDPKEARIDKFGRQIKGLVGDAAKLGALGIGASVGLFALVKRAADAGDAVDDVAGRLKISGAALQAFRLQGELAGATSEDVDNSISKLSINIGKVLTARKKGAGGFGAVEGLTIFPGKPAKGGDDPFKAIGLNVKTLKNLSPEKQLEAIADGIAKLPTQAERAAAATATLGKAGAKLLPILEKGGAALKAFREEGLKNGRFMSDDATKAASDFNDALKELETVGIGSVVNALGGTLLPVGTRTMKDLTKWIGQNGDKIRAWAQSVAAWIEGKALPAIKNAGIWFIDTGGKIVGVVDRVAGLVGGFGNLAIAIAALRAAPLAVTVGQMILSLGRYSQALLTAGAAQRALEGGSLGTAAKTSLGLLGAAGAVAAAGAAGFAIGTALDNAFGISDWVAGVGRIKGDDDAAFARDEARRKGLRENNRLIANPGLSGSARAAAPTSAAGLADEAAIRARARAQLAPPRAPARGGVTNHHTYAPTIHLAPGQSEKEIRPILDEHAAEFERRMKKQQAEHRRLAFAEAP